MIHFRSVSDKVSSLRTIIAKYLDMTEFVTFWFRYLKHS